MEQLWAANHLTISKSCVTNIRHTDGIRTLTEYSTHTYYPFISPPLSNTLFYPAFPHFKCIKHLQLLSTEDQGCPARHAPRAALRRKFRQTMQPQVHINYLNIMFS